MIAIQNQNDNTDRERPRGKEAGLKINDSIYGVRYMGTSSDLVNAGLVQPEQLPGVGGPRKKSAVYYGGVAAVRGRRYPCDEHYLEITLVGSDRFSVWKPHSNEVRVSREQHEAQRLASERERMKVKEAAAFDLSKIPDSRESYRQSSLEFLNQLIRAALWNVQECDRHGYSVDFNTLQEMQAGAARMRNALSEGGIKFDAGRHERIVSKLSNAAGVPIKKKAHLRLVGSEELDSGEGGNE